MKRLAPLLALALVSAALPACGEDDDGNASDAADVRAESAGETANDEPVGERVVVEVARDGGLAYTTDRATIEVSNAAIEFTNRQATPHDVVLEDSAGKVRRRTALISDDYDSVVATDLEPGRYAFYCSVPGHREAGMEGTLVVKP